MKEEGYSEEQISTIHAPIGLPIGGHMPAEIAVSITAEIVQEKINTMFPILMKQ